MFSTRVKISGDYTGVRLPQMIHQTLVVEAVQVAAVAVGAETEIEGGRAQCFAGVVEVRLTRAGGTHRLGDMMDDLERHALAVAVRDR
ncbi:hypothetical protein LV779_02655 [Streptomyces thinghirensis]|nr:hypothetical protein [Streptomyces thinghirensis]